MTALLDVSRLKKHYPVRRGAWQRTVGSVRAVEDVSFRLETGETLGLVGESGCGKTTVARTVLRLTEPTAGSVLFDGIDVHGLDGRALRALRPRMQMVFQDPYSSLNPRRSVGGSVEEPLLEHTSMRRAERHDRVRELLTIVGLDPAFEARYPHELSGGQRQRVGIARALASQPELIVCDEPISALDVSIQGQIVNLLEDVQDRFGVAYLFISHDLGMVRHLCDRVAVMYLGRIAEIGSCDAVFHDPKHPYTQALVTRATLQGEIPSPQHAPPGCAFHTRCPVAEARCKEDTPELNDVGDTHRAACHLL